MKAGTGITLLILSCLLYCSTIIPGNTDRNDKSLFSGGDIVPVSAKKIYIHTFTSSETIRFNISELMIRLKKSLNRDSRLTVTENIDEAEIILAGEIIKYTIQPLIFNPQGKAELKRMRITLSLSLYNSITGEQIFQRRVVEALHEYSDIKPPIETELRAGLNLIDKITPRIAAQLFTGWYTEELTPHERGKKE